MKKRLTNNLGLKLISLVLAALLWFLVVQIGDPKDDRDFGNIEVKLVNTELLDRENKVYEVLDGTDKVRVTVYAPKSVFTQLRSSDITAEADVSKLTDINTIPISFSAANANVVSIRGSHDVVKLNVEEKSSKYVNLISSAVGDVQSGYIVSALTPDQNRIEVSGPKSAVDQVKYAGAEIDVTEANANLTAKVDIKLYDAEGNEVVRSNLVKNTDYVRMSVEILSVKEVPVEFESGGTAANGYMATGEIQSKVTSVRLAGSAYNLSGISSIVIPEDALDITGASGDVTKIIDLKDYLPEGVKLADSSFSGKFTVTIFVEPIREREMQIPIENIAVIHVPDGFKAEISESAETEFTVKFSGLGEDVNQLSPDNVKGQIDITAWMEKQNVENLRIGTYTVPVKFLIDAAVSIDKEYTVRIVISEADA